MFVVVQVGVCIGGLQIAPQPRNIRRKRGLPRSKKYPRPSTNNLTNIFVVFVLVTGILNVFLLEKHKSKRFFNTELH